MIATEQTEPKTSPAGKGRSALARQAIRVAAQWIVEGRRIEMHSLAEELGVSRVTLFRNLGPREEILSEALWHLTEATLQLAQRRWETERPSGALYSPGTGEQINALVSRSQALHRLLADEPALTIRVLTDPSGRVQTGVVDFVEGLLRRDIDEHGLVPIADPRDLAFALVRLGESFLYADVLANRPPDIDAANRVQGALVQGTNGAPGTDRSTSTRPRRKTNR